MVVKILLALLLGGLVIGLIEPLCLRTTYSRLPLSTKQRCLLTRRRCVPPQRFAAKKQVLKAGELRLLFFSDLHVNHLRLSRRYLSRRFLAAKPDLMIFGGDLISRGRHAEKGLAVLHDLANAAEKAGVPLCMVRGNHDASLSDDQLSRTGVILLKNASLWLEWKEQRLPALRLSGLDDIRSGQSDLELACTQGPATSAAELNRRFPGMRLRFYEGSPATHHNSPQSSAATREGDEKSCVRLAVGHNPDTVIPLNASAIDYFFSGHFHGGQIRLPFRLEFKTLRGEKLSRQGYYDGHFLMNGITAFISCGVGCVLFPLRFLSLPEITVFDFASLTDTARET